MSSEDADDERESPAPTPVSEWVDHKSLKFTVFVVLPHEEVCTLRDLPSGISVHNIKERLELSAGIPCQVYSLIYPDGEELPDDQKLVVRESITHGYLLRMRLHDNWEGLYQAVHRNNIEQVYHSGGVHLKGNITISSGETDRYESVVKERGGAALYMAAYLGHQRMVNMLLSVGVSSKSPTLFGRTPLHGAVAKDQVIVAEILISKGAVTTQKDYFGVTPLDVARNMNSVLCLRKMRLIQLNLRGQSARQAFTRPKTLVAKLPSTANGDRSLSKQSHNSEINSILKDSSSVHASRRFISTSAPLTETRNTDSPREGTHSSLSTATTGKLQTNKRTVKWKDTSTEYRYWKIEGTPRKVEEAVSVQPVKYSLPKTIYKFSELENARATSANTAPSLQNDREHLKDGRNLTPELVQAMNFSKQKLKQFHKLANPSNDYVPMANRKKPHTRENNVEISETFRRWLERKEEEEEAANQSSEGEYFNQSDSEEDPMIQFNKRVRKMNRNNTPRSLTPGNRPVLNIMEFGSTVEGDGRNPPPELNMNAFNEWRQKRRETPLEKPVVKSSKDLMVQKRRLEEKRQKLLLTAISYDEWLDHTEERKLLIRQILKADQNEMRKLEDERLKDREKLYSYDLWRDKLKKRDMENRRRKNVQKKYDQDIMKEKSARAPKPVQFDRWLNEKRSDMQKERLVEKMIPLEGLRGNPSKTELQERYRNGHDKENAQLQSKTGGHGVDITVNNESVLRRTLAS